MQKLKFMTAEEFYCELNMTAHAINETIHDNISDIDIKKTILNGEKTENYRGGGAKYQYDVIVVVADSEDCHKFRRGGSFGEARTTGISGYGIGTSYLPGAVHGSVESFRGRYGCDPHNWAHIPAHTKKYTELSVAVGE